MKLRTSAYQHWNWLHDGSDVCNPRLRFLGGGFVQYIPRNMHTGFCFAVLCCGYTLTDFPIPIRLISLALWQSNDCPNASKATLMKMDKYFMWIHYERLHNHNKAKHNKTVCIFLGIYCSSFNYDFSSMASKMDVWNVIGKYAAWRD